MLKRNLFIILVILFIPLYTYALSTEAVKLRLEYNHKKAKVIKNIFDGQVLNYDRGAGTFLELVTWNENLYRVKYEIIVDKFLVNDPNFNPESNAKYLKEKLAIHLEELEFFKTKLSHFILYKKEGLLFISDLQLLQLKSIDAYSAFKITSILYSAVTSEKHPMYIDLPKEIEKLFPEEE